MKKQLLALLLTSLVFTVGCGEEAQSTDVTQDVTSNTEVSMPSEVPDIPKVEYDYDIYERFTPNEIINMCYSPRGLFSYTTDYDRKKMTAIARDEALNVDFKLTNMTNQTLSIEFAEPPTTNFESTLCIATSGSEQLRYTFEPYETKVFSYSFSVNDYTIFDEHICYFYSSIAFIIYEPRTWIEDYSLSFYIIRLDKIPVFIKGED